MYPPSIFHLVPVHVFWAHPLIHSFIVLQAVTGNLGILPPDNRTDIERGKLFGYLNQVGQVMEWNPFKVSQSVHHHFGSRIASFHL